MNDRDAELIAYARGQAEQAGSIDARKFDWLCGRVRDALDALFPGRPGGLQALHSRERAQYVVVMRPDWYLVWRRGIEAMKKKSPADLCYGFPLRAGPADQAEEFVVVPREGAAR